ncbi:cytochrome c3 family protein [Candidatus Poribacteria bacterium]|nr:cytochrome c3 family protein [Candidatus Poribacteria bacterium]
MMKKSLALLLIVVFGIIVLAEISFANKKNPPETIEIDFVKDKKPVVHFQHKKHFEERKIKCQECHHKNKEGEEQPCRECHKKAKDGEKPAYKDAFHKNCNEDCHKKNKKGPQKCDGEAGVTCHVK